MNHTWRRNAVELLAILGGVLVLAGSLAGAVWAVGAIALAVTP